MNTSMKWLIWIPGVLIIIFLIILYNFWSELDNTSIATISGVLVGALAGMMGSSIAGLFSHIRAERESQDKLRDYASSQALKLTELEFNRRRETKQKKFLAPAKVYREFYKALYELFTQGTWPKTIEDMGLLDILDYSKPESEGNSVN